MEYFARSNSLSIPAIIETRQIEERKTQVGSRRSGWKVTVCFDGFRVHSLAGPDKIQSKYRVRDPVIEIDPDCENYLTAGSINTLIDLMVKK